MARQSRSSKPASVLLCGVLLAGWGWIGHRSAGAVHFAEAQRPPSQDPYPNWPVPPTTIEGWMALEKKQRTAKRFEMRVAKDAGAGVTGALDVTFYVPDEGVELRTKWKRAPDGLDDMNNSPRRELGAYAVQKLFLDSEDFVVPTSAFRCLPLEVVHPHEPDAVATIDGTQCELGLFSVWLKNVTVPDPLYDETRFVSDPQYAYYMANFNLLTYLIAHKDGRAGNFLVSKNDRRRQVFAVDNGIAFDVAFGGLWFNWFVPNWHKIRVAALRKESIDRLREVRREDLDSLGVLAQLEGDEQGRLQPVRPTANLDPSKGARVRGMTIQLGLKRSEIDNVYDRIQGVIHAVDEGTIGFLSVTPEG